MDPQLMSLVKLTAIVLLPVIPALLLFIALPSTALVSGPFQGLKINLGGAFGGYFVLVLVVISTHSTWDPAPNYKLWTVVGSVVEQDGTPVRVLQSSDINLQPPITSTDDAGGFKIQIATGVGPANTPTYPTLTVKRDGYFPAPVELDPKNTQGQRWLSNVQRVNIPRITLQRMPKYISSGTPLVPVAAPEGIHP